MRFQVGMVAVALMVSGCAVEEGTPNASTQASTTESVNFEDTGVVRGVVTDDSQLPVEDAAVVVGEKTAMSDALGSFEIRDVAVGKHLLSASKPGYMNVSLEVEVQAASATEVKLRLVPAPSTEAYHESQTQSGLHACGVGWRTTSNPPGYAGVCIALQHAGASVVDKSMIIWHAKIGNASGFWFETTWKPSTALRGGMNVLWGYVLDDGLSVKAVRSGGARQSPLRLSSPIENWTAAIKATPSVFCKSTECEIRSFHASYGETLGASAPADAGVVVNQRYDVWMSTFFNGPLPKDFTALPPSS